jgi:hypothetical protein
MFPGHPRSFRLYHGHRVRPLPPAFSSAPTAVVHPYHAGGPEVAMFPGAKTRPTFLADVIWNDGNLSIIFHPPFILNTLENPWWMLVRIRTHTWEHFAILGAVCFLGDGITRRIIKWPKSGQTPRWKFDINTEKLQEPNSTIPWFA